ncbi:MAG: antibiotic biosynthesis monooxygenase [Saprospiraceae bacterium]
MIAQTPEPPYYAVIFSNVLTEQTEGYEEMAKQMVELAKQQVGFLGFESVRNGLGITISYWESEAAIAQWKRNERHMVAQSKGMQQWYESYVTRVCKVERAYYGPENRELNL